jgi:beta-lactamase class A
MVIRTKTFWYVIGTIVFINILIWIGFFRTTDGNTVTDSKAKYPYLSARIFAESPNDILINFVPLRKQLEARFDSLPAGTKYSFYFEYLPSGTSIRIGDNNELVAASLIKVPLVMNLYKAAELGKINLDAKVTIQESELDNAYGDLWQKGAGTQLTLRELAKLTLEKSDNTASHAIYDHVRSLLEEEDQSLAQLDVDQNQQNGQAVINAKSYTSVLKSLYLASYVSRDDSEEILTYLTHSSEHNRLTKKLPSSVKVAHKNGVYNQLWSESDCGIVYAQKRPYAICIMIGLPDTEANTFMADTSKIIYDYIVSVSTEQK